MPRVWSARLHLDLPCVGLLHATDPLRGEGVPARGSLQGGSDRQPEALGDRLTGVVTAMVEASSVPVVEGLGEAFEIRMIVRAYFEEHFDQRRSGLLQASASLATAVAEGSHVVSSQGSMLDVAPRGSSTEGGHP